MPGTLPGIGSLRFAMVRSSGFVAAAAVSEPLYLRGVVEKASTSPSRRAAPGRPAAARAPDRVDRAAGIWTIQSGIFPENDASLRLHERAGFRVVGRRARLGKLHGVWRDVLLVERRSEVIE